MQLFTSEGRLKKGVEELIRTGELVVLTKSEYQLLNANTTFLSKGVVRGVRRFERRDEKTATLETEGGRKFYCVWDTQYELPFLKWKEGPRPTDQQIQRAREAAKVCFLNTRGREEV
jgi:hypothetical protein